MSQLEPGNFPNRFTREGLNAANGAAGNAAAGGDTASDGPGAADAAGDENAVVVGGERDGSANTTAGTSANAAASLPTAPTPGANAAMAVQTMLLLALITLVLALLSKRPILLKSEGEQARALPKFKPRPHTPTRVERDLMTIRKLDTLVDNVDRLQSRTDLTARRDEVLLRGLFEELAPDVLARIDGSGEADPESIAEAIARENEAERRGFEGTEDYEDEADVSELRLSSDPVQERPPRAPDDYDDLLAWLPGAKAQPMHDRPIVALRCEVMRAIRDECTKHPHVETGGMLLGKREAWGDFDALDVQGHIGPGVNVARHVAMFRGVGGEAAVKTFLWYYYNHPGTVYVGEWHKHPSGFTRPSGGDYATVTAKMLPHEPELLIPIVAAPSGRNWNQYQIRFYWITRARPEFIELPVRLVTRATPLPPEPLPDDVPSITWRHKIPDRFRVERVLLERLGTFSVDPDEDDAGSLWIRTSSPDGLNLMFLTGPDYPNTPPEVYGADEDGSPFQVEISDLLGAKWEPRFYLIHAVAAWREVLGKGELETV